MADLRSTSVPTTKVNQAIRVNEKRETTTFLSEFKPFEIQFKIGNRVRIPQRFYGFYYF